MGKQKYKILITECTLYEDKFNFALCTSIKSVYKYESLRLNYMLEYSLKNNYECAEKSF